jgi:hypothetical protein
LENCKIKKKKTLTYSLLIFWKFPFMVIFFKEAFFIPSSLRIICYKLKDIKNLRLTGALGWDLWSSSRQVREPFLLLGCMGKGLWQSTFIIFSLYSSPSHFNMNTIFPINTIFSKTTSKSSYKYTGLFVCSTLPFNDSTYLLRHPGSLKIIFSKKPNSAQPRQLIGASLCTNQILSINNNQNNLTIFTTTYQIKSPYGFAGPGDIPKTPSTLNTAIIWFHGSRLHFQNPTIPNSTVIWFHGSRLYFQNPKSIIYFTLPSFPNILKISLNVFPINDKYSLNVHNNIAVYEWVLAILNHY